MLKLAARADLHHLGQFLQGRQADAPQEALQVLDIVLRELPTHRYSSSLFVISVSLCLSVKCMTSFLLNFDGALKVLSCWEIVLFPIFGSQATTRGWTRELARLLSKHSTYADGPLSKHRLGSSDPSVSDTEIIVVICCCLLCRMLLFNGTILFLCLQTCPLLHLLSHSLS